MILGGRLPAPEEYAPAAYIRAVRQRARRVALAQLRTGSHWLGEETGRWARVPREQRVCPHCQGGVEGVHHVLLSAHCMLRRAVASATCSPLVPSLRWPHSCSNARGSCLPLCLSATAGMLLLLLQPPGQRRRLHLAQRRWPAVVLSGTYGPVPLHICVAV